MQFKLVKPINRAQDHRKKNKLNHRQKRQFEKEKKEEIKDKKRIRKINLAQKEKLASTKISRGINFQEMISQRIRRKVMNMGIDKINNLRMLSKIMRRKDIRIRRIGDRIKERRSAGGAGTIIFKSI